MFISVWNFPPLFSSSINRAWAELTQPLPQGVIVVYLFLQLSCTIIAFFGDIPNVIQIWSTLTRICRGFKPIRNEEILISFYNMVDATPVASVSQSLHSPHRLYRVYRLCGKLGLSITCFRFGKIPPPTSFSLTRRFWVFVVVVSEW